MTTGGASLAWMLRARYLACIALILGGLAAPGAANAQSSSGSNPGAVTVDPNSPAGTEYDIPIARARRDASKGSGAGKNGSDLFGAGIKSETTSTTASSAPRPTKSGKRDKGTKSAPPVPISQPAGGRLVADETDSQGGGSASMFAVLGGGLAVVAFGAGAGWFFRRRAQ